ncbi:hypothetical protein [Pleionea litopenaei]|uniref:Uncharacterized protein n=1 Tax=Pleionea litopenaei TaxID=3070815 RepID=A0AA51RVN2_9GAMM|nr:hypothetical protein [Pleionea sp. HL-JVS1]WMS88410.1 hypothetical protein Q9312_05715 [Pleionea sp. HL-JVS1]
MLVKTLFPAACLVVSAVASFIVSADGSDNKLPTHETSNEAPFLAVQELGKKDYQAVIDLNQIACFARSNKGVHGPKEMHGITLKKDFFNFITPQANQTLPFYGSDRRFSFRNDEALAQPLNGDCRIIAQLWAKAPTGTLTVSAQQNVFRATEKINPNYCEQAVYVEHKISLFGQPISWQAKITETNRLISEGKCPIIELPKIVQVPTYLTAASDFALSCRRDLNQLEQFKLSFKSKHLSKSEFWSGNSFESFEDCENRLNQLIEKHNQQPTSDIKIASTLSTETNTNVKMPDSIVLSLLRYDFTTEVLGETFNGSTQVYF